MLPGGAGIFGQQEHSRSFAVEAVQGMDGAADFLFQKNRGAVEEVAPSGVSGHKGRFIQCHQVVILVENLGLFEGDDFTIPIFVFVSGSADGESDCLAFLYAIAGSGGKGAAENGDIPRSDFGLDGPAGKAWAGEILQELIQPHIVLWPVNLISGLESTIGKLARIIQS